MTQEIARQSTSDAESCPPLIGSSPEARASGRVLNILKKPITLFLRYPLRSFFAIIAIVLLSFSAGTVYFIYHLDQARQAVALSHNVDAKNHLQACQTICPDWLFENREVLLLSSRVAWRTGNLDEAAGYLDRYWQLYGDDEKLVFERIMLRAIRGETEETLPYLSTKIDRGGPEATLAREALITGLLFRFRWADASRLIDSWLELEPENAIAHLYHGKLLEQRHQTSVAILTYQRVLELDPALDDARLRLAGLNLELRQGAEALSHLSYLRAKLPDHPKIRTLWAQSLSLQGRIEEARDEMASCLKAHPNSPDVLAEAGRLAASSGDNNSAVELLERATRLDPGNMAARNQYFVVLSSLGRTEAANREQARIKEIEADNRHIDEIIAGPLQSQPYDPAVHHEIGMIALRSGLLPDAMKWFQRALQVDPNYQPTHRVLVEIYIKTDNPILAAKHRAFLGRVDNKK